jgi:hypothetical protein
MSSTSESSPQPLAPAAFKDRRLGLVIMGLLQLLCGGFSLLMGLLLQLLLRLPLPDGSTPPPPGYAAAGLAVFAGIAIFFIWTGIGSIQARRWARALMVMTSLLWLICGAACMIIMSLVIPSLVKSMISGDDPGFQAMVIAGLLAAYAFVLVLAPVAFLLFYRSPHVKATCERRHPEPCWTDRCPLPVLTLAIGAGLMVPILLLSGLNGAPVPFFGQMLSRPAAGANVLVMAILWGYVAWGCYRLQMPAWWLLQILTVFHCASMIITLNVIGLEKFCQTMFMPSGPMEALLPSLSAHLSMFMLVSLVVWIAWCGYLFWIHRYFVQGPSGS